MCIRDRDYPSYRQQFLAAFQERVDFRAEYRLRRRDRTFRWLLDSGVPLFNEHGEFVGYIGYCVDITDRKTIEDALVQSERKFKALFDLSADPQLLLDGERVVDCNPAAVAMLRVPDRWALIGRAASDFLTRPEGMSAEFADYLHEALARNSSRFEWMGTTVDGAEAPIEVLLTSVPTGSRTLLHAVIRDLSGRHALERRLRQAEKMEALGTLAGGIAHDFNNLLGAIMGYTELALMDLPAPAGTQAAVSLTESLTAARRARDVVQQILTFSRHDDVRRVNTDLGRVVQEGARLLRASIPSTIEIRVRTSPGCVVLGNSTQLQQVLLNLGANAEHAMRATGGGALDIQLTRERLDEERAQRFEGFNEGDLVATLVVRDSGEGMPDRVRARAFDPFFTTKPVGEGTGMGLSVVHGIITSHGGAIAVESEPGRGTTFTLVFPCVEAESVRPSTAPYFPVSARPRGSGRVLVVEDEVAIGRMLRRLLGRLGYEAEVFENAPDALASVRLDPSRFDVMITDLTMPGMTGDELSARVRELRPDLPILLATGYGPSLSPERARQLGIVSVLRKPVTVQELVNALDAALNTGRASFPP